MDPLSYDGQRLMAQGHLVEGRRAFLAAQGPLASSEPLGHDDFTVEHVSEEITDSVARAQAVAFWQRGWREARAAHRKALGFDDSPFTAPTQQAG